uniref:Translation initiation factor eIF2B subunit epsilon n=1 Tax=Kwoniella bestiolae CBS 10118 TaxID=1296100 RepID=A0A1B9G7Y0_9TREE|nr:translation initiation factor eIF-2B subunit epsilon [Kwoniella bestiolae CBS 10118]OCF27090.1 translation initiation factor eIF-2B subunit epsilon [Kwoniella bestiolae CBS 10118]
MPPKKNQPAKAEPKTKADNVDEAPLQAVILADSYNRRFEVLCSDQPRVLLPLCSTPLLAWTLESLSLSKVKQVFVFCGVHSDKIRAFIETSPYRHTLDIQCLSSQTAMSAGDALRELDDMSVLNAENPFILVHSPIISNYDISKMVEAHKKRREEDKNFIMTMGLTSFGLSPFAPRRHPESPIMLVHPPSSRLLHYVQNPLSPSQPRLSIPSQLFLDPFPANIDTYEIWSGTPDLGVDICEADVPALCTENFDYHDMRRHFVNGVLTSELLGKKIAVHLVGKDELNGEEERQKGDVRSGNGGTYVERIRDTRTFGEITRDVLRRWAFPLAPDNNEPGGVQYELRAGNVYIAKDNVVLSRTTTLSGPLLIGPRSALAHNTRIHQSTLGADCSVGPSTTISQSYIFDDVRIGANCTIRECIVGEGVVVSDDVVIGKGALIGNGVRLGKGTKVPDFARIGRERYRGEGYDSEEDDEEDERDDHLSSLGPDSTGYLWPNEEEEPASDSEDEAEDPYEHPRNKQLLQLGRRLSNVSSSSVSLSTLSKASSSEGSIASVSSEASTLPDLAPLSLNQGPREEFYIEARESLARAYEEDHKVENAALEMRTLVMGENAGQDAAREEILKFFLSKITLQGGAGEILKSATSMFSRWGGLVRSFATSDFTLIAIDTQKYCVENESYRSWFGIILRGLYDSDTISEDELIDWRDSSVSKGEGTKDEEEKRGWLEVYGKGKPFVDVLESMESDEDEDDEEEEEEDSD